MFANTIAQNLNPANLSDFKISAPQLTSNCAVIVLAFLLTTCPTALKFLSLSSAKSSSAEFNTMVLNSMSDELLSFLFTNFSGGSLTDAGVRSEILCTSMSEKWDILLPDVTQE